MTQPLTDAINALTRYANEVTGQSDTNLSDAVRTLCDGYGGGGGDDLTGLINGSLTSITSDETFIRQGVCDSCKSLVSASFPNVTIEKGRWFANCTALTSVNLPKVTSFEGNDTYASCTSLLSMIFPNATSSPNGNHFRSSGFNTLVFPKLVSTGLNALNGCTELTTVDFGETYATMGDYTFNGSTNVNKLILRKSSECVRLGNIRALTPTKFKNGGAGGEIYIPKVLYDHLGDGTALDYKSASNWATIDGYGTITWKQIEGSIYETQYADGTPIE